MTAAETGYIDIASAVSGSRQRLIPHMRDLQDTVFRLLPASRVGEGYRVLDIGTASGLLIERLMDEWPEAVVDMVHEAEPNLNVARQRLQRYGDRISYQFGDYTRMNFDGPYDAVISELEASFLENKSKRTLLSAAYAALRRGGRVISIVQVRGATDYLEAHYLAEWNRMIDELGATEADRKTTVITSARNRTSTLAQQLEWMAGDGFENVDCFVKFWRFAVIAGDKV